MVMYWGPKLRALFFLAVVIFFIYFIYHSSFGYETEIKLRTDEESEPEEPLYVEENLNGSSVPMDDPRLVRKLREKYLLPPPYSPIHQYRLSAPAVEDPSIGQSKIIRDILKDKTNGFFIECGALDGETYSNTLFLERYRNWTGLLIEAYPLNFDKLKGKNRRAYLSQSCLSLNTYPEMVSFELPKDVDNGHGRISGAIGGQSKPGFIDVQCFPLYTYFLAMDIKHVDYFSLDIEGGELAVLKTIPFDKVDIQTLSVEFLHVTDGETSLKNFMESKGYKVQNKVTHGNNLANDLIFVKS